MPIIKMKSTHKGRLTVDPPDNFRVTVNTLTLREIDGKPEVTFDFHYVYHDAPDRLQGVAHRQPEGHYVSAQKEGETIYILKMPSPDNEHYLEA